MASDERKIDPEVQEIIADEKRLVRGAQKMRRQPKKREIDLQEKR
jgi:hypothetical protein